MTHSELIEAIESGDTSPAINEEIAKIAGHTPTTFPQYEPDGQTPNYLCSLDAAISLIERTMPDDFGWNVGRSSYMRYIGERNHRHWCEIWSVRNGLRITSGKHNDKCRAILISFLKALEELRRV